MTGSLSSVQITDLPYDSASSECKILVVDDKQANLIAISSILAELDADIHCVNSGSEALSKVLRHEYSLIILDVFMPGMDGIEFATLLSHNESSKFIPIIFLTAGSPDLAHEYKGYGVGAVDYIYKPIKAHILLSKVRVFVQLSFQKQAIRRELTTNKKLRDDHSLLLKAIGEAVLG